MNGDLLVALAGGAIGAIVAGIGFVILRISGVPDEVARHDRCVRALDEDLERWIADDHRALKAEIEVIAGDFNARNLFFSGFHLAQRAEAKTRALQRYRDRRSESERALADLDAEESWPHAVWRWVRRRPGLTLHAPERIEPVIDDWRAPARAPGMTEQATVDDPTRRTTDDVLREVRERPLDRQPHAAEGP